MLFNTYQFIFAFLPLVLLGFFWIARKSHRLGALWLAAASLFFYAWWNLSFVFLLLASIVFNYLAGYLIGNSQGTGRSRHLLAGAIVSNLLVLCIFKYTNFFLAAANSAGAEFPILNIVLPLGISFFTFTQIAFLVDVHRGIAREFNFTHYLLFVTWFPHLIAGPVLHHKQMMPQFAFGATYKPCAESLAVGLTLFSLGLFKKVVFADQFALYANPIFDAAALGEQPLLFEAWIGALAYTLQLYFDFSGYSDMAIGLSRLFNIKLPLNFNSPYKAENIIDFWRRWHMTLSTFLREYLYIPLGGNRNGPLRRHFNLMTTMLLGGLWHGAGWTFVLWGGLHGVYLVINHGWRKISDSYFAVDGSLARSLGVAITFTCVVIAWVPFRAASLEATMTMLSGMAGLNGAALPTMVGATTGLNLKEAMIWLPLGLIVVWFVPNTQTWLAKFSPAWDNVTKSYSFGWQPNRRHAVLIGAILGIDLLCLNRVSEFLYFQF